MNNVKAPVLLIAGILLALGGVGGVEHSLDNSQLLVSTGIAILGLLAMYAGTLLINSNDSY